MIGILIVAHDNLGDSLIRAVSHVLGGRPPQFEQFGVAAMREGNSATDMKSRFGNEPATRPLSS